MHWGPVYDGEDAPELSHEEDVMLTRVNLGPMDEGVATKVLDDMRLDQPFLNRLEFINCIAALVSKQWKEMGRHASPKDHPGQALGPCL